MELADWERSFAVNSTGHFLIAREAHARAQGPGPGRGLRLRGHQERDVAGKDFSAYSAAKAAEAQLAKVLALEGGRTASGPTS
jgi:NAD(P)-dependent dehydrogenase (short-subunit alcohol dehydrogenase family)